MDSDITAACHMCNYKVFTMCAKLSGACIVIGSVCLCVFVGLFVGLAVTTITQIVCIDLHQTGSVGEGSDHIQLIKFWPFCAPGGAKIFGSAILQPARSVCVSLTAFFIYLVFAVVLSISGGPIGESWRQGLAITTASFIRRKWRHHPRLSSSLTSDLAPVAVGRPPLRQPLTFTVLRRRMGLWIRRRSIFRLRRRQSQGQRPRNVQRRTTNHMQHAACEVNHPNCRRPTLSPTTTSAPERVVTATKQPQAIRSGKLPKRRILHRDARAPPPREGRLAACSNRRVLRELWGRQAAPQTTARPSCRWPTYFCRQATSVKPPRTPVHTGSETSPRH